MNIIELAKPALWFDMETGHWKVLSEPDRPTYEPYYTREQMREFAAFIRAQALEEAARKRVKPPRKLPKRGMGALWGEQQHCYELGYREGASAVRAAIRALKDKP